MPEGYHKLPEKFAIVDHTNPSPRYFFFRTDSLPDVDYQLVNSYYPEEENIQIVTREYYCSTELNTWNVKYNDADMSVRFWPLQFYISVSRYGEWIYDIPVYDMIERSAFCCGELYMEFSEDSVCVARNQRLQRDAWNSIYERFYAQARAVTYEPAPVAEPPAPSRKGIPRIVSDSLIRLAKIDDLSCSISLTPFRELEDIVVTDCYHLFDRESLVSWCRVGRGCPTCRAPITNI